MPQRIRDVLTLGSKLRYSAWRLLKSRRPLAVTLRSGPTIVLRPPPARDLTTAHDIFVSEIYDPAAGCGAGPDSLIVDVGANVGYSAVYFANRFRDSRVLAFEPHPAFADRFEQHMALNRFGPRVTLLRAAAYTRSGTAILHDAEDSSAIVERPGSGTMPVATTDFFEAAGTGPVALLKMDIEGAEVPLLADPRFDALDVRMILLEWHDPDASGRGKAWCVERLTTLGFEVTPGRQDGPNTGLITAVRPLKTGRSAPPRPSDAPPRY